MLSLINFAAYLVNIALNNHVGIKVYFNCHYRQSMMQSHIGLQ